MSDPAEDGLSITDAQINFAGVLALACTIPGTCLCFMALVAYAVAASFPKARVPFDRVSFRLLVYTLIFNVFFGVAYAVTAYAIVRPGPGCSFGAFAVNFTLSFSTFFTTCIAINLQLVLVHGVDGKMMEKYYVIVTTILSVVLNVPAFALHQFGWDEESSTCWYKNPDDRIRLRWIIGTQSFWISLAATIETICSCIVLLWLSRFQRTTDRLWRVAPKTASETETTTTPHNANSSAFTRSSLARFVTQHPEYRNIILRIALYPIISLMVNYSTVVLDLNTTIRGINTQLDFRLLVLDLILYGVRTFAYGVLAFMDPSFIRAVLEIHNSRQGFPPKGGTFSSVVFASGRARVTIPLSYAATQGEGSNPTADFNTQQTTHSDGLGGNDLEDVGVASQPEDPQRLQGTDSTSRHKFEELRNFARQL